MQAYRVTTLAARWDCSPWGMPWSANGKPIRLTQGKAGENLTIPRCGTAAQAHRRYWQAALYRVRFVTGADPQGRDSACARCAE